MQSDAIVVTGATGTVGAAVARRLVEGGWPARLAVRDPQKAQAQFGEAPRCVRFDFEQPATFADAFAGARKLFLVRPPAIARVGPTLNAAVDAALAAGVRHVVFLSLLGAEQNPLVPHRAVERHLEKRGVPYTFLRPSFFMQNLSTTHREDLRARGELFVPAGHGRTSFIDARDVADVVVAVLTESGHTGRAYALTGPAALTYFEAAEVFSDVLGRRVTYANPSALRFGVRMWRRGHPLSFVAVMIGIYTAARLGLAGRVTGDVERLLGRPPTPLRRFVEDYRACWTREEETPPANAAA